MTTLKIEPSLLLLHKGRFGIGILHEEHRNCMIRVQQRLPSKIGIPVNHTQAHRSPPLLQYHLDPRGGTRHNRSQPGDLLIPCPLGQTLSRHGRDSLNVRYPSATRITRSTADMMSEGLRATMVD